MTVAGLPGKSDVRRLLQEFLDPQETCCPRKVDKPLVLYGAGDLGQMAKSYFNALDIPFIYVVDAHADYYLDHPAWRGIPILKPEDVPVNHRAEYLLVICIVTSSYTSICAPLINQGWLDIVHFYDITESYTDRYPLHNGWFSGEYDANDLEEIIYTLNGWDDDISRGHHLQFIAWHQLRKELIFADAPVDTHNRYFIPEIISSLHDGEIFIDGGAHHGEVSLRFMDIMEHKFKKIYAVEPDRINIEVLSARLGSIKISKSQEIKIIDCALGREMGDSPFFHGLGYVSQIGSRGKESVMVQTLDDLDIPMTFIKLHLEGWEYDALLGAVHNLNKYRPLIAVTIYHNRNGLWRIPSLLMKKLSDYVFLLRLHAWMGTGCVLYALPRERYKSPRNG